MMEASTTAEQRKDMSGRDGGTTTWDPETNGLIYRSGDCCFNACTFTSDHYHCQACGISTAEVSQALAHIRASPTCRKDPLVNYSTSSVAMATDPTNTLYNAIYNGFSAQSSYPSAGFSGYSQIDSFQWHAAMPDKVTICSSQLSPCCSSNGATYIPVESQLCSPISDLYSKVNPIRDLVSLPAKSSGSAIDSPAWFAAYNPQQIQKPAYKYTDQNTPPQINFILLDPSDQKHQDIGESSASLPSSFCAKNDLVGKDVLKESYCSYSSQPLPGILSEDALFSLNLQDDSLKQADVHQTPVPQILLSDVTAPSKTVPQNESVASTSRVETHFTQEHFSHYMSSCSAFSSPIVHDNNNREAIDTSHQPSSAASDSDESDIVVEDTGDDLGSQMTESEIFIEDIKCSLLQGVASEEENQTVRTGVFQNKGGESAQHSRKEPQQTAIGEETKIRAESQLKDCLSYHALLKCVICEKSVSDGNAGSVFVQMSTQMPLTTSSQTPVLTKLNEVVAIDVMDFLDVNGKFMCQNCFNLVDTVDSLESKLESLKQGIAAMIKAGTKPLILNHNQCVKLPDHMLEQNHSTMMNIPTSIKSSSTPVSVQNIQALFQDTLVGNSTIAKPVGSQEQVASQNVTNDAEQKEYLLLSGRALSLANSISKVSLSLSQHHSTDIVQNEQCEAQNVAHEETCNLRKLPDMPSQVYHLSSVDPTSKHDGEATTSHIEPYPLSQKITSKEEVVATYEHLECQKEHVTSPKGKQTNEEEGKCYRLCKNDLDIEIDYKENREAEVDGKKKLSFPSILSMDVEQVDEQKPHSSECIMENCHSMLRLERTMEENIRKESCAGDQLKFACDLCCELFSSNELLQNHLSQFVKSDSSLCELCGQLYHNQWQLDDHMFDSHFVYQKHCKFCATLFFHPCTFKLHLQSRCGEKTNSSSQCARTSHENSSMKRGNTSEMPPFVCNKCNQTFQMRSHLEHHIKATHVLKKALSKCNQCERTFIKPSDLQAHKRSHSNEKKFECKVCGRKYKSISNLNHHAKSHEMTKPFTCDICSQGFTRKDFFETHLNSHKDNKPFKCEKCLKSFSCKAYLQVHLKWHEDKVKKVMCPICKKSFSQRLNIHMRSHTGERPHPCEKCPKKFITGSALKKHMKRLHREDLSNTTEYSVSDGSDPALSDSDEPKSPLPS